MHLIANIVNFLQFIDTRECGMNLANRQRPLVPDRGVDWMELVVTPIPESPDRFHEVSIFRGETTVLPGVELTPEFMAFLRGLQYTEKT